MGKFGLVEDQACCGILDHLERFKCTCREASEEGVVIVKLGYMTDAWIRS